MVVLTYPMTLLIGLVLFCASARVVKKVTVLSAGSILPNTCGITVVKSKLSYPVAPV